MTNAVQSYPETKTSWAPRASMKVILTEGFWTVTEKYIEQVLQRSLTGSEQMYLCWVYFPKHTNVGKHVLPWSLGSGWEDHPAKQLQGSAVQTQQQKDGVWKCIIKGKQVDRFIFKGLNQR